ncbi:DUF3426 domain-containing protein [Psychrobacter proteolyticus]|uniref:DUF3426 domain-containing protein n=1 Tax=Psychrobacter proteolyticus TaxID=147825 RepID=UPI000E0C7B6D|nr:DUF3426 domain-containing protein [Psychrobacter proteolyticus]
MITPIRAQCPHCQADFTIQKSQLNKVDATIRCNQCKQEFLVNKHLIVTQDVSDHSLTQATETTYPKAKSPINKKCSADNVVYDDLIYDDMEVDESDDIILEYDSLESMDTWLTQASTANLSTTGITDVLRKKPYKNIDDSHERLSTPSTTHTAINSSPIVQGALSSTAANDIHASIDNTSDNSWLEALLKEQNPHQELPVEDTDLSQLLIEMGISKKDEDSFVKQHVRKAPLQTGTMSAAHSIASMLWIVGCLVLALLLAAQYVMFNLETLIKNPNNAQHLQKLCVVAACSLPNADLKALTVTNLSHRSSQVQTSGIFSDIGATLSNESTQAQLYPNIKISVYGKDELIGEFIADPNDYLLGKQSQLAANTERQLLFTIPVANAQIRDITMTALY